MFEVTILKEGNSFGELALISSQKTRQATIRCLTDCYFGVLEKGDYELSLGKIQRHNIDKMVNFLKSCPYFASWTKNSLAKLYYFFHKKKCFRDQIIFKEG